MNITVVGTGYVGLVAGACFAELGNHVFCLDLDRSKVELLNAGRVPIHEAGLPHLIERNRAAGRLVFSTDVAASVAHAEVQFIAVGTPPGEDGSADLQHVLAAAREIGRNMTDFKVIVNKSTVPVGTATMVEQTVLRELSTRGLQTPFAVASNPEFLKEGVAVEDFMRPDRVVVGVESTPHGERAFEMLRALYAPLNRNRDRLHRMSVRSAELTKYAANAMLATRISFMNEIANLADRVGADVDQIRRGIGADSRIGPSFLYAGTGYGGSCFPKDIQALCRTAAAHGQRLRVLEAVEQVNEEQKTVLVDKVVARFGADLRGRTFAVWGLSFKPDTDDMRQAPSRAVIRALIERGARVQAYDPVAIDEARRCLAADLSSLRQPQSLFFVDDMLDALEGVDGLLLLTEWKEFRGIEPELLQNMVVFDGRNLYDPVTMARAGVEYIGIGRRA